MKGDAAPRPREDGERPPRVLVFSSLFPRRSRPQLGCFVRDRVVAMAKHCPVRVVVPVLSRWQAPDMASTTDDIEIDYVPYTTIPVVGRALDGWVVYRQVLATIERLRREFPFDVIDAHYAFPDGTAAVQLARHFDVPVAVTVRGGDLNVLSGFPLRRRVISATLRRADRVIAISRYLADRARALGVDNDSLVTIANGVDPELFRFGERDTARRAVGCAVDGDLLVCAGTLLADKGQDVLIEALARMREHGQTVPQVVLLGDERDRWRGYRRRLEACIDEKGLTDRVRLLGEVPQAVLADWYRAADLLVLPTKKEGGPNVVREALACGTPTIASRVGGVPELLTSESFGAMVEPDDPDALASAIVDVLGQRLDRRRIAAECGDRDWQVVGSACAAEITQLARR